MNNYMEKTAQNWANVEETAQTTQKVSTQPLLFTPFIQITFFSPPSFLIRTFED